MAGKRPLEEMAVQPSHREPEGTRATERASTAQHEIPADPDQSEDVNGVVGRGFIYRADPNKRDQKRAKSVEVGRDWVNLHPPAFPHLQTFCSFLCTAKHSCAPNSISYFSPIILAIAFLRFRSRLQLHSCSSARNHNVPCSALLTPATTPFPCNTFVCR